MRSERSKPESIRGGVVTLFPAVTSLALKRMTALNATKGGVMAPTKACGLSKQELDTIAWGFLRSEFTGQIYSDWPLDRRIDAYLEHRGLTDFAYDGSAYDELLDCVMTNIGPALRKGILEPPSL